MNNAAKMAPCLVCEEPLELRPAQGRRSGKPFLMLVCPRDGRHFRGFINDKEFVAGVMSRLESHTPVANSDLDREDEDVPEGRSKTNLELPS